MFLYGGSWQSGNRGLYRFVGKLLASRGIVTFIPDYRVYPEVRYPEFLRDNARAVAFAKGHAAIWGGDPKRLFLVGHSAGAYDAAMLTLDPRWLGAVGMDPARDVAGMVGLAGPYDFLPLKDETLKTIFGPPARLPATQPINHVVAAAPPAASRRRQGHRGRSREHPPPRREGQGAGRPGGGRRCSGEGPRRPAPCAGDPVRPSLGAARPGGRFIDGTSVEPKVEGGGVSLAILIFVIAVALVGGHGLAPGPSSGRRGNAGWVDVVWTFATGAGGRGLRPRPDSGYAPGARSLLAAALVALWSLRLGLHLARRTAASAGRTRAMPRSAGTGAERSRPGCSLFLHAPGAGVAILLAASVLVAARNPAPGPRAARSWPERAVLLVAILGEGAGRPPAGALQGLSGQQGGICDVGLWAWSRHPNYFFEWLGWLAYPVIAVRPDLAAGPGAGSR